MQKRKQKSAVINLSSFAGEMAYPFITLYAATKAFNKEISNAIAVEYPSIDVMCLKPMFV
jgi:17beta-estradiol 17-dehydrogenase / very-long-chain 3-oxoacyl-CoA reductase